MAYGFDVESSLSLLVGLARKSGGFKLRKALVLPGMAVDIEQKPDVYSIAPLGQTWKALHGMGVKPGYPATLVPGKDVYYRFTHSSTNTKLVDTQVRLEADEIGGGEAKILADYVTGVDYDYSPAIHIALAREEVIDHFANCLKSAGVETGPLIPGCVALFQAYLVSGDTESEHVQLYANVGDDATDVILVREGQLLYARTIGIGVGDFVTRLIPEYGNDRDTVRQVLFRELDLRPSVAADNLSGDRGVEGGQEVAARLIQQIGSSIMLARGAQKAPRLDPRKIVISGSGAAISGLRELMSNRMRKPVEIFDPMAGIDTDGVDEQSAESARSYGPALALAVGLAVLATDQKRESVVFLPAGVRARREFLNKSLFLYLAAALVIAVVLPLYLLSANSLAEAETQLNDRERGPIGRYVGASNEIESHEKALSRARERTRATRLAPGAGKVSTDVLLNFARVRPETVRIRRATLDTDTRNPTGDPEARPRTTLVIDFFIESRPGKDPANVNNELRQVLLEIDGVAAVRPGRPSANGAVGLDVTHTIELDLLAGEDE